MRPLEPQLQAILRNVPEPVVGGQGDQGPVQADLPVEEIEEGAEADVEPQQLVVGLPTQGSELVVHIVVSRQGNGQQVRYPGPIVPELFSPDRGAGEIERIFVGEGCVEELPMVSGKRSLIGAGKPVWECCADPSYVTVVCIRSGFDVTIRIRGTQEFPGLPPPSVLG